jgi:integrase
VSARTSAGSTEKPTSYFRRCRGASGVRRDLLGGGLVGHSPHAMRHTFASLLLSEGRSIAYVSRQLGHKNAQVTLTV